MLKLSAPVYVTKDGTYQEKPNCLDKGPDNEDIECPSPVPMLINESVSRLFQPFIPSDMTLYSPTQYGPNLRPQERADCIYGHRTVPYHHQTRKPNTD